MFAAALLPMGGCMENSGEYYTEIPHTAAEVGEDNRFGEDGADNYYALQSAVLSMIGARRESNVIPITNYSGSLEDDIKKLTQEIMTENPLGCFAVASLGFDQTRVLTYQELSISIQYKRSAVEIAAVKETPTVEDFERRLTDILSDYGSGGFYSVTDLQDSDEELYQRVLKCWLSSANTAYGLKNIEFESFPAKASRRIVEVKIEWTDDPYTLKEQSNKAFQRAESVCQGKETLDTAEKLRFIEQFLSSKVIYDDKAMRVVAETNGRQPRTSTYTAYGALLEGQAAQSGMVHAAKLMLDQLQVPCRLISGSNGGISYVWLRVQVDGVWYYYDPLGQVSLMNEEQAKLAGYVYDTMVYHFES